jgi:hypothetical protein
MRWIVLISMVAVHGVARAEPTPIRCDDLSTADLTVDGLLDEWPKPALLRIGVAPDGQIELRCSWDGTALALALDVKDDRVVRLRGKGHEDHVGVSIAATGRPLAFDVYPGNPIAKAKVIKPAKIAVADSLQPKGFSIEARIPASVIAGLSASTPSLALRVVFHDSDQAAGGDDFDIPLEATIELGDRKDLLDDFLKAVRLRKGDVRVDTLADLDPDRRGTERLVAGGTVIGVLTDQFAFVSLPAAKPTDVRKVELLALGPRGQKIVSALVRQSGNGGSRDLLMLWTVWSGQLQPLAQIEVRKEMGGNLLDAGWKIVKGKRGPELWVEPKPAVGWTAQTWNEMAADDADAIVLPWDAAKGGVAYALEGAEVRRRDLPAPKRPR